MHPLAGTLQIGVVVDGVPENNVYQVKVPHIAGVVTAVLGTPIGQPPAGAQSMMALQAGTKVLLYIPPGADGYNQPFIIVCALPFVFRYPSSSITDKDIRDQSYPPLVQARDDINDSDYIKQHEGTEKFVAGDSFGMAWPSGTQLWANVAQAVLKAGAKAGVEAHVIDSLLKIIGFNMTFFAGGCVDERISDKGEYSEFCLIVPYLWRAKEGALSPMQSYPSTKPIPQYLRLRGYAGDLELTLVQLQPPEQTSGITMPDGALVLRARKAFDGSYQLHSAKSIEFGRINPQAPVTRIQIPANVDPTYPAGVIDPSSSEMGDYTSESPGFGQTPTGSGYDTRKLQTTITVIPDSIEGNYFGMIARDESIFKNAQYELTIDHHALLDRGAAPEFESEATESATISGSDHRDTIRLYKILRELDSLFKISEDGTTTLQVGDSKLVIGSSGIEIYASTISCVGTDIALGAERVALSAFDNLQLVSEDSLALYGRSGTIFAENFQPGFIFCNRQDYSFASAPSKIEIYTNTSGVWSLAKEVAISGGSSGHAIIDVSDLAIWGRCAIKVHVVTTDGEYLEAPVDISIPHDATSYISLLSSDGQPPQLRAKVEMTTDDVFYPCVYLAPDGTEGTQINCKRPVGVYVATGDSGFLGEARTTHNYSQTPAAGMEGESSTVPAVGLDFETGSALDAGQLATIAADDENSIDYTATSLTYAGHRFDFNVSSWSGEVSSATLTIKGYGENGGAHDYEVYIWRAYTSSWVKVGEITSASKDTLQVSLPGLVETAGAYIYQTGGSDYLSIAAIGPAGDDENPSIVHSYYVELDATTVDKDNMFIPAQWRVRVSSDDETAKWLSDKLVEYQDGGNPAGAIEFSVANDGADEQYQTKVKTTNSIEIASAPVDSLQLVGDEADPGPDKYYGTNASSTKGFHALPTASHEQTIITDIRYFHDTAAGYAYLQVKTKKIKVVTAYDESDWITWATAAPCP